MNENLNLVDMLKYCPKGTKLYSVVHGEVKLEAIVETDEYPIKYSVKAQNNTTYRASVSIDGRCHLFNNGECTLFPSKENRDWSKFNTKPKFDISILEPYAKVLVRDGNAGKWHYNLFDSLEKTPYYSFICVGGRFHQCIPYNKETKHLHNTNEMPHEKYITWEE